MATGIYILLSLLMIPYAGVQDDEALFAVPFWQSLGRRFEIRAFHHSIPLMLISYLGTLKTALYWVLLKVFDPNIWTVRVPMALVGALTVYFFYRLLQRSSPRVAILGTVLLATEPTFLLTNTFDWGPVGLEHLLLVSGCYSLACFRDTQKLKDLSIGFFLLGLALWNKALFLWALSGAVMGALIVFWPEVRAAMTRRNLTAASLAFVLGAFPFILFNLRRPGATVGENVHLDTAALSSKWLQVENAANGNALFGFIAEEDFADSPKRMTSATGRTAAWIQRSLGSYRKTGFLYAFAALLACFPLWKGSRAAKFSLIFLLVAGGLMMLTKDAGGAAHHIVLLWPFPIVFVAVSLVALPWRWLAALAGTALVALNLLVINQYLFQFERNGAAGNFSDALFQLARSLPRYHVERIYVIDWGIANSVQLSNRGQLPLRFASDPLMNDSPDSTQRGQLLAMLSDPQAVFVDHVISREVFAGVGTRLQRFADSNGFKREMLETVADSNTRPVFEIFRFQKD